MCKFSLIALVLALSLRAGPISGFLVDGFVQPGNTPNYDAQIPGVIVMTNLNGLTVEELLAENPQYAFSLWELDNRQLVAYFDRINGAKAVIVTTVAPAWEFKEESNFERFIPPIVIPPTEPPVQPPHPPCVGCEPVHPPNCIPNCHPLPPVCIGHDCEPPVPPVSDVPEPGTLIFIGSGFVAIAVIRKRK